MTTPQQPASDQAPAAATVNPDATLVRDELAPASTVDLIQPGGGVVILREEDLDEDLDAAVQRIRSQPDTRRSRILVIGPESETDNEAEAGEVSLATPRLPIGGAQLSRLGERELLAGIGARIDWLVGCVGRFHEEARLAIREIEESAVEAPRARIQNSIRRVAEILDWAEEASEDMRAEALHALEGKRRIDPEQLCTEMAQAVRAFFPNIRTTVIPGAEKFSVVGASAQLAEAMFHALVVVSHRIGGDGLIQIEAKASADTLCLDIHGTGEPRDISLPESVDRLREIVAAHGGTLEPTETGLGGAGLRIRLPRVWD